MKRTELKRRKEMPRGSELERKPLQRKTALRSGQQASRPRASTFAKPRAISPASEAQRIKVALMTCWVCGADGCVPAHVIDRSLGGCDHEDCVWAACPLCHRAYDDGGLDLLPYLEPYRRSEQQHAVGHVGIARALRRITNERQEAA